MRIVEIWKDIHGYEGLYEASSFGRVRSLDRVTSKGYKVKGRVKKLTVGGRGYYNVKLSGKTMAVHQLVAMAFLGHIPNGHSLVVDHIDNDKINNKLDNLQLITQRHNASKDRKGSSKYTGVSWNKRYSKWRSSIVIKGRTKHLGYFTDEEEAKEAYEIELKKL
jgi:hypothetical protein